ncbi:MAG: hypothetical protein IGQ45_12395 [Cyanobacterium sp. T60_A2020_053]|nr:hypothetical protein [Cyanobacterium sp. T60_A2020_053]
MEQEHIRSVLNSRAEKRQQKKVKKKIFQQTVETTLRLTVNISISALAIFSVKELLPYHSVQQAKLAEIDGEIAKIRPRVERLEESFGATFDPQLSQKVMKQNTYKVDPNLRPIFFKDK